VQLTREAKSGLFCSISMHGKSLSNLVENFWITLVFISSG
jgi:hypothetical protein